VVVPRDLSVIGCDDVQGASIYPALTSISSRSAESRRIAVEMPLTTLQVDQKTGLRCVLDTRLVLRATTAKRPTSATRKK
jgi:DNA-binding LacI/PurR family transcriptional regulator